MGFLSFLPLEENIQPVLLFCIHFFQRNETIIALPPKIVKTPPVTCLTPTPYTYTLNRNCKDDKVMRIFSKNREDHGAHTCRPALRYYLQDRNCGFGVSHFSLLLLFTSRGMKQHIRGKSGFSCSRLPLSTSYSECLLAPQQPGRSYFTCIVQAASFGQRGLTTEPPVRKGALPPPRLLL